MWDNVAHVRTVIPLYHQEFYLPGSWKMGSTYVETTLRALSNKKSLALFNTVAFPLSQDTDAMMTKFGRTKRQYYSRINLLIDAGLVMRENGKYVLTLLGKVAYESNMLIEHAPKNYWKLKAIESIGMSIHDQDLSAERRKSIVDTLIKSHMLSSKEDKIDNKQIINNYLSFILQG